ncbi:MAG: hypothetical protein IH905_11140 [Proteobacteria bacterium]|nr:hypothetical protein [Pseudomonadota bacterium]
MSTAPQDRPNGAVKAPASPRQSTPRYTTGKTVHTGAATVPADYDRVDLSAEMSMAIRLAKKYGGIGSVCQALDVSETAARTVGFVGLSRISISGVHYEPSEDGPLAVVIPVTDGPWDEEPAVYDLLAFLLDVPNRCWSRLGNARTLGRWHLRDSAWKAAWPIRDDSQDPVIAYRTPLEWLQNGCRGFCCLNEDWLAYEVTGVSSIQPADGDVEFGRHLKRLIYEPSHLPKILIPRAAA